MISGAPLEGVLNDCREATAVVLNINGDRNAGSLNVAFIRQLLELRHSEHDPHRVNVRINDRPCRRQAVLNRDTDLNLLDDVVESRDGRLRLRAIPRDDRHILEVEV